MLELPESTRHCRIGSPLGDMLLAATEQGLAGAWFVERQRDLPDSARWHRAARDDALLQQAARQLDEYFAGQRRSFELPLDLSAGSAFEQAVWRALLAIDWGRTMSYAGVASAIGRSGAARAVGRAVGRNPVSIVVPCHRVLGSDGRLTGFGGGIDRKIALLAIESPQIALFDAAGAPGALGAAP